MYTDVTTKYISETSTDSYSRSWNKMQTQWKCCGSFNYTDYTDNDNFYTPAAPVPWTCCVMKDGTSGEEIGDVVNITLCRTEGTRNYPSTDNYIALYPTGCYDALVSFVDENAAIIIGVTCGFIGLQILGSIMSCILMKKGGD